MKRTATGCASSPRPRARPARRPGRPARVDQHRATVIGTRTFGTRDDKALQTAVAVLTPPAGKRAP